MQQGPMHGIDAGADLGQGLGGGKAGRDAAQRLHDHAGGHLSRLMAAGTIGDGPDTEIGAIHERILIVRSDRAHMGQRGGEDAEHHAGQLRRLDIGDHGREQVRVGQAEQLHPSWGNMRAAFGPPDRVILWA